MASSLFETTYNPDVLTCLANLSNDEVFTPPNVVNDMLDMLPQELFSDPTTKFLDPVCKSGVFLREIAKRLIKGLEKQIPDLQERLDHIYKEQLYGIAITELTSLMSRRSLYCSKAPNRKYSVVRFKDIQGNVRFKAMEHRFQNGRCVYCGASEAAFGKKERGAGMESHAYEFIHTIKPEEIWNMKFDVIIGNPPYQLSDGGQKASATPIYQLFIQQAKKLKPRFMTMIIPARWYSGGRGLDSFRDEMLSDRSITKLVDFTDSEDCFPGVDIAGGVCYFLWERDKKTDCEIISNHNGKATKTVRPLNQYDTFIRDGEALQIIEKVLAKTKSFLDQKVSSQKPFGLRTYVKPEKTGDLILRYGGGKGPFPSSMVTSGKEWIPEWKVIMSYLTYDHAGRPDKDGKRRIFSTMEVLGPSEVCTETYLVINSFKTEQEAKNFYGYLTTCFVRFLVSQLTATQHLSKASFKFVPLLDFTKAWDDVSLFKEFGINEQEQQYIESMIRPMTNKEGE